jgi:hypothetical protein
MVVLVAMIVLAAVVGAFIGAFLLTSEVMLCQSLFHYDVLHPSNHPWLVILVTVPFGAWLGGAAAISFYLTTTRNHRCAEMIAVAAAMPCMVVAPVRSGIPAHFDWESVQVLFDPRAEGAPFLWSIALAAWGVWRLWNRRPTDRYRITSQR